MPSSERRSGTWDLKPHTTLPPLLAANARLLPQEVAFREKDRGIWQETTWQTARDKALRCAAGLQALGLAKGQAVLILGDNRPHLYLGMLAVGMLGGYATPVYPDATPEEIMHVVSSVQVHYVLAEDQELSPSEISAILGISRPLVVLRMDRGELPFRYVGKHRRALLKDVLALKSKLDKRQTAMEALAEDTEDLIGTYDL